MTNLALIAAGLAIFAGGILFGMAIRRSADRIAEPDLSEGEGYR